MSAGDFALRFRKRARLAGYWSMMDCPVSTEWIAHVGWDFIVIDLQHGLVGYTGMVSGLQAVDSSNSAVGIVRVEANNAGLIGRALDAGAAGVIVPLVNTAEEAAAAVRAAKYPPAGIRSFGPMRSQLRIGPSPAEADRDTVVIVMIETPEGLANVEDICAVPGVDGVYVGPADLRFAVGGTSPDDASVDDVFEQAIVRICDAAAGSDVAAGIHVLTGTAAARRLANGFTFAAVSSDLTHLVEVSAGHLEAAMGPERKDSHRPTY